MPAQVLELPILSTICLLSSSFTVHFAVSALRKDNIRGCTLGLAGTVLLGAIFLMLTAREWYHLIHDFGLTIRTNLFGTTFYSLVGLHATSRCDWADHADDCACAVAERPREGEACGAAGGAVALLALCRWGVGCCVSGCLRSG